MNILELRVKFGIFKESITLEDSDLQKELNERMSDIFSYLEKLYRDQDVSNFLIDKESYINLISRLSSYFMNFPIHNDISEFFGFITEVIYNWNNNSLKDKNIETFTLMFNRLIECRNKLNQSIDIIKESYERYVELSNWQPPVFDLAIEYFDKLLEDNEQKIQEKVTK